MKTTAEMIREYFAAPADVKEFLAQNYGDVLPIETSAPKKPRKLFNNDFAKMAKVEENLENVLNRFSSFLSDLYIKTEGENDFAVNTHGKFVNLWDLCVQEGGGVFEIVTNWLYPEEIYLGIEDERGEMTFEKYPEAFRKIHFLENRREELLDKRDRLMEEYGDDYCFDAGLFTSGTKINPKKKKSA